jgi:hypothetical protein
MAREYIKKEGDLIPIADTQGIVRTTSYMVPDYANMEGTNRITDTGQSWTVPATGFIHVTLITALGTNCSVSVNGKSILNIVGGPNFRYRAQYALAPVKAGDVVSSSGPAASTVDATFTNYRVVFIPPVFVTPSQPVVEIGSDYSLDEQPVMINDGTQVRQKRWINGKGIYVRTFTGSVDITQVGVQASVELLPTGIVETIVDSSGTAGVFWTYQQGLGHMNYYGNQYDAAHLMTSSIDMHSTNALNLRMWAANTGLHPYTVTVYYTKIA